MEDGTAYVMKREDGELLAEGTVRDAKSGERLPGEEPRHVGGQVVTWVEFPDGWKVTLARLL